MQAWTVACVDRLDPERIAFVGKPCFDPAPYLDDRGREVFLRPLQASAEPEEYVGALPSVQVHVVDEKREQFLELLDASGRLALFRPEEVRQQYLSGIFAVGKDADRDRMIMDARRPNVLERPLGRWIRSLASGEGLCRLQLLPHERVVFSGNDVRDFYHLFAVPRERALRNSLCMYIPEVRCRRFSAYRAAEHSTSKYLVPALNTLAMGDCQAVELAQTCHLCMAWREGVISPSMTLTLSGPAPRSSCFGGIVIDDFVVGQKVPRELAGTSPSEGALAADRLSQTYVRKGLIPHHGKAFRDQAKATFWGTDVDGEAGLIRGSLERAIPLMYVLLRVVSLRVATPSLLQVIAGSLVSLFIYRRRLLSLLDQVFAVAQHREANEVLQISPELQTELMLCALLLPLAVTNIRASVLPQVFATDASGWGEAEVSCEIPVSIAREAVRHSLRKSVWVRLLSPLQALARLHGDLRPDAELPDNQTYAMHPLWETLIRFPTYRLCWKAKSSRRRHINVSELRAFLRSERRQGHRHPESRGLRASDSQVTLGCVQKGRSSSKALNQELKQSLPNVLGNDIYSEGIFVDTKLNPADDPTRGAEIRAPSQSQPAWWESACQGDFSALDTWLHEVGQTFPVQWGIPDPSELLGPSWQHCQALPRTDGPPERRGSIPGASSGIRSDRAQGSMSHYKSSGSENVRHDITAGPEYHSCFSSDVSECLRSFKCSHFLWPRCKGSRQKVRTWDLSKPGYLDLFSGCKGVAKVVSKAADTWSLCIDIAHDPKLDLLDAELRGKLEFLISRGAFFAVGAAPACGSFSIAVTPAVRDAISPQGKPDISEAMQAKVALGNSISRWLVQVTTLCLANDIVF